MAHIDPSPDQLERLTAESADRTGPIRMINLLRFREVADYGDHPDPAESGASSGMEAYLRYGETALREIDAVGGSQFYGAPVDATVIGPADEQWDMVAIIEYPSRAAFLEMVAKPSYQSAVHHRTAGLADTRLIMTSPVGG